MPKHHTDCQFDLYSWQEFMELLMSHLDAQRTVLKILWIFLVIPSFVFLPRVYIQGEKFRRNNVSHLKSTSRCKYIFILCFLLATLYYLEAIERYTTRYSGKNFLMLLIQFVTQESVIACVKSALLAYLAGFVQHDSSCSAVLSRWQLLLTCQHWQK